MKFTLSANQGSLPCTCSSYSLGNVLAMGNESSSRTSGGDTEPEILFMHAYDHRRWRIAQTIEKLGFNLYFWF